MDYAKLMENHIQLEHRLRISGKEIAKLKAERDRYREALELIVENYKAMSPWDNKLIIPNLRIANDALEGEK
jgi:hypothetical protein